MGLYKNSDRVWVPGLDKVQGIVVEERKSLRHGMFYTVEWRDNETLLDQSREFAEGILSGVQTADGVALKHPAVNAAAGLSEGQLAALVEHEIQRRKDAKKLKKKNKKRSRKKSKSKR